ncbi:MAG: hypothetical protein ABI616_05665 [Pseudomonadota bacterium]
MTNDSITPWVLQYRASVEDAPTPKLDQAILAAAGSHLARRRTTRLIARVSVIGAFAMFAISPVPNVRHPATDSRTASGYGRFEGTSRSYLLEVQTHHFTGFGVAEDIP